MKKTTKVLLFIVLFALTLLLKSGNISAAQPLSSVSGKVNSTQYIWPIGGDNTNETYIDYEFYGQWNMAPYKNGKSGREYIVNNKLWPNERYYYAASESHFGMDITGINGHTYKVVSVVNGTVIATSGTAAAMYNPSVYYADQNQRMTSQGLANGAGYGNYIIIQESSTGRCFLYGHLKGGTLKVTKGSKVTAGQEIATMGSSGDAGHMHLHFEIRRSKAVTISENVDGTHYLVNANSTTNLDPIYYIGSTPNVHVPVEDKKLVNLSKDDVEAYISYLYRTVLLREAGKSEIETWEKRYENTGSIFFITKGIFLSSEAQSKRGEISNLEFSKKAYEIILYRGTNYTESEMSGHVKKLDSGIWTKEDYIAYLCNSKEFVDSKIDKIIKSEKDRIQSSYVYGLAPETELKIIGDLDGDGCITSCDASICIQLANRYSNKYEYAIKYADIDGDGKVTFSDASFILSYYAYRSTGGKEKSITEMFR